MFCLSRVSIPFVKMLDLILTNGFFEIFTTQEKWDLLKRLWNKHLPDFVECFSSSLFSQSSILCGPGDSLQRVQEDQGHLQTPRFCSAVSVTILTDGDTCCTHIKHWCWRVVWVFLSFNGLLQFQGEVRKKVLNQLLMLLCHSFPMVSSQNICTNPQNRFYLVN